MAVWVTTLVLVVGLHTGSGWRLVAPRLHPPRAAQAPAPVLSAAGGGCLGRQLVTGMRPDASTARAA